MLRVCAWPEEHDYGIIEKTTGRREPGCLLNQSAIYTGLRLESILSLRIEDVSIYNKSSISIAMIQDKGGDWAERILSNMLLRLSGLR